MPLLTKPALQELVMADVDCIPTRNPCSLSARKLLHPEFSVEDNDLAGIAWGNANGYARTRRLISGKTKSYFAHRIVMSRILGRPLSTSDVIDHLNRNKTDNRRHNLQLVSRLQNAQNCSLRKDNISGHRGVYWNAINNKWVVQVRFKRKTIYGGYFTDVLKAAAYAKELRRAYSFHGESNGNSLER